MKGLLIWLLAAAGVSGVGSGAIRHDVPEAEYRELARRAEYAAAALLLDAGEPEASGVLVTPGWVLTAGHEVDALSDPDRLTVQVGGEAYAVGEIVRHPAYEKEGLGHGVDLALLRLEHPATGVTPARRYRGEDEVGRTLTAVGYGTFGTASSVLTDPQPTGTKRAGTNVIDQIGGTVDDRDLPANLMISDFDPPADRSVNRTGDVTALPTEYLPLGGDSGGGVFIDVDGETFVAGVVSALTPHIPDDASAGLYGSLFYSVRLSLYNDWIDGVTGSGDA